MSPTIAEQLRLWDIDAVTVRDLALLGDTDENHLERATAMGRVFCTHDTDFLIMAGESTDHAGIAFAEQYGASIGGWVRSLRKLHAEATTEAMVGQVKYLRAK